jgi:hypothetical protein
VNFTNREVTAAEIDTLVNGGGGSFPLGGGGGFAAMAGQSAIASESMDSAELLSTLVGASSLGSATLGGKLAAGGVFGRIWQPIKSFESDRAAIGFDRLIGAMSVFGAEAIADWGTRGSESFDRGDLHQLAIGPESRHAYQVRNEFRAAIE